MPSHTGTRKRPPARRSLLGVILLGALAAALLSASGGSAASGTPPKTTNQPTIYGTPVEGKTLFTDDGSWSGTQPIRFQYRWLRCDTSGGGVNGVNCTIIKGATQRTYVLTTADVGHRIRSHVIATNGFGTASFNSNATTVVRPASALSPPVNTQPPTISGSPVENQTLTADRGTWKSDSPVSYAYQWRRCDQAGGSCASIGGATQKTYTLKGVDVGNTLRLQVRATNTNGRSFARSAPTAVISKASAPSGATVSINDVSLPNRLLVDHVNFSPGSYHHQRTIVVRVHVSDSHNHNVLGALVFFESTPLGWTNRPPERTTGPDGTVTFLIHPSSNVRRMRSGEITWFIRARKQGENPLGGVTARRLVGLYIH